MIIINGLIIEIFPFNNNKPRKKIPLTDMREWVNTVLDQDVYNLIWQLQGIFERKFKTDWNKWIGGERIIKLKYIGDPDNAIKNIEKIIDDLKLFYDITNYQPTIKMKILKQNNEEN